jgi:hypothetical protein
MFLILFLAQLLCSQIHAGHRAPLISAALPESKSSAAFALDAPSIGFKLARVGLWGILILCPNWLGACPKRYFCG